MRTTCLAFYTQAFICGIGLFMGIFVYKKKRMSPALSMISDNDDEILNPSVSQLTHFVSIIRP